jgi:hypothetical protein
MRINGKGLALGEATLLARLVTLRVKTKQHAKRTKSTSALGHEQTSRHVRVMSVVPLKADIHRREWLVRYVPIVDMPISTP